EPRRGRSCRALARAGRRRPLRGRARRAGARRRVLRRAHRRGARRRAQRLGGGGDPARRHLRRRLRGPRRRPERVEPAAPRLRRRHRVVRARERARRCAAVRRLGRCCSGGSALSDRYIRGVRRLALVLGVACVLVAAGTASARGGAKPWLWQCEQIHLEQAKDECYVRLLLQDIDRSGDPANELPRIDRRARAADTSLYGRCHMLMHVVGRRWAAEHHLTLDRLQSVVPRSNDPGCSAGFGMGLVMELGPKIIATGGRSALPACTSLPTRLRQFTCVHSLGHALMRGYHEALFLAVRACTRLGTRYAPDCAQGAFHDYWIALRGADDTTSPQHAVRSPRALCAQYPRYALGCWYRYWIEQVPGPLLQSARDLTRVCARLVGTQRAGCIAGAAKDVSDTPVGQTRMCAQLRTHDALA